MIQGPAVMENEAGTRSLPASALRGSQGKVGTLVLIVATAAGIALCYAMAAPFLPALVAALSLAVLFMPLERWLEARLGPPGLAAAISVVVIGLIVVLPASFVLQRLVAQAASSATMIENRVASGEWRRSIEAQPRLGPIVARIEQRIDLSGIVKTSTDRLSHVAGSIVRGSAVQLVGFCLTFYLLFFFLRDRRAALLAVKALSPLPERETDRLLARVGDVIHATIYGTLSVALIQGLLGGLMFWWLGLSAPLLWGVVMALLAVVPVLGAFVVWIPAALFLALEGDFGKAAILALWCLLVVGTIDNLLRPILVGKRLQQHTVLAFMSVVGGLIVFGAPGLILGPVVLTITIVLLETWPGRAAQEYGT